MTTSDNPLDTREIEAHELASIPKALAMAFGMSLAILKARGTLTIEQVDAISRLSDEFLGAMIDGKFIEIDGPDYKIHTREEAQAIIKKQDTLEIGG